MVPCGWLLGGVLAGGVLAGGVLGVVVDGLLMLFPLELLEFDGELMSLLEPIAFVSEDVLATLWCFLW